MCLAGFGGQRCLFKELQPILEIYQFFGRIEFNLSSTDPYRAICFVTRTLYYLHRSHMGKIHYVSSMPLENVDKDNRSKFKDGCQEILSIIRKTTGQQEIQVNYKKNMRRGKTRERKIHNQMKLHCWLTKRKKIGEKQFRFVFFLFLLLYEHKQTNFNNHNEP